jgi:hypothetical protein
VNLFQVLGRSLYQTFLLRLSISLSLVVVVAVTVSQAVSTLVAVVRAGIGHQSAANHLVVAVQPNHQWRWQAV